MRKIMYYDLETSGTDPRLHAILQMAVIIEIDGKVVNTTSFDLAPWKGAAVATRALEVNGIDAGDLYHRPDPLLQFVAFKSLLDMYVDKYDKADKITISGYNNTAFDDQFLREFFVRHETGSRFYVYGSYFGHHSLDAKPLLAWLHHCGQLNRPERQLENLKLQSVCDHLGIPLVNAHDALADVKATRVLCRRLDRVIRAIDEEKIAGADNWIAKELTSEMADEEDPGVPMSKELIEDGAALTNIARSPKP